MIKLQPLYLITVVFLAGCSAATPEPEVKTQILKPNTILSSTAALSHTTVRSANDEHIICSQTAPDAAFDQDNGVNLSIALVNTGSTDAAGDEEGSEEVEMSGRTPTVLLTRELFYRTCEFAVNYNLDKDEAKEMFEKSLDIISQAWMVEAGNTTVTIGDTLDNSFKTDLSTSLIGTDSVLAQPTDDDDDD